jgi:hypothetical protein
MAASRPRHVARTRRCDARRMRRSRKTAFARALVRLVVGDGQDEQRKDTRAFASDAFPENGKWGRVLQTLAAPYSAISVASEAILRAVRTTGRM